MPARKLRIVHISSGESSYGSTGTVNVRLMGIEDASLTPKPTVEQVNSIGYLGPSPIAALVAAHGEGSLSGKATYEDMPRVFNGFFAAISVSTSTAPPPYVYPYAAPQASTQAIYTYTVEYGTTGAAYRAPGSLFSKLNIKGEAGKLWEYQVDTLHQAIIPTTSGLSTSISDRAVNPIRMADTTLYVDAFSTGTIGSTAQANTLISFDATIDTKRHLKTFAGSIYPTDWGEGTWDLSLKIVAEFNASAKGWVDATLGTGGTIAPALLQKQIRISATQGVASSASYRLTQLDFAVTHMDGEKLFDDREGNMTVALSFKGQISTALGNWFAASFSNNSSSTT